jgi:hypothetical protein
MQKNASYAGYLAPSPKDGFSSYFVGWLHYGIALGRVKLLGEISSMTCVMGNGAIPAITRGGAGTREVGHNAATGEHGEWRTFLMRDAWRGFVPPGT